MIDPKRIQGAIEELERDPGRGGRAARLVFAIAALTVFAGVLGGVASHPSWVAISMCPYGLAVFLWKRQGRDLGATALCLLAGLASLFAEGWPAWVASIGGSAGLLLLGSAWCVVPLTSPILTEPDVDRP